MIWHICLVLETSRRWHHCRPSVTCMDWWYNHLADAVPLSTALTFVIKTSVKHKHSSPSAIQLENRWNTLSFGEKLDVVSRLEKGRTHVDIYHNVRLPHVSMVLERVPKSMPWAMAASIHVLLNTSWLSPT